LQRGKKEKGEKRDGLELRRGGKRKTPFTSHFLADGKGKLKKEKGGDTLSFSLWAQEKKRKDKEKGLSFSFLREKKKRGREKLKEKRKSRVLLGDRGREEGTERNLPPLSPARARRTISHFSLSERNGGYGRGDGILSSSRNIPTKKGAI